VEATFSDSEGRCHTSGDKSAIFTTDWRLDAASKYPQSGVIRSQILARWQMPTGPNVVRVTTEIESTEGASEFVVLTDSAFNVRFPCAHCGSMSDIEICLPRAARTTIFVKYTCR
jgi:hypothetical protein